MEVLDKVGPDGFLCHRCHHILTEADRNAGGHEQSTRLNDQFEFISELLPKIDAVRIPECDFDRALANARPVIRDATHPRAATTAVDLGSNLPMAVRGLTNTGPQSIAVNISTSDGPTEAEKEAERARKEQIAKQNALPAWMSNSTVTGESFSGTAGVGTTAAKQEDDRGMSQSKLVDSKTSAQIDDIFARLKAEQAAERAREIAEEDGEFDSDDEDGGEGEADEGDFEDVPASSFNTSTTPTVKRQSSGDVSRDGDSSDDRQTKRVKVEVEIKKEEDLEDSEEDEELEFEDV